MTFYSAFERSLRSDMVQEEKVLQFLKRQIVKALNSTDNNRAILYLQSALAEEIRSLKMQEKA